MLSVARTLPPPLPVPIPSAPSSDAETAPAESPAERDWVARARAGDRSAFGRIHQRFVAMVHSIVLAHAAPRDAADLVQEVFARALAGIERLRDDERIGAWLGAIARNVARESVRSRRPVAPLDETRVPAPSSGDAREDAREVLEAIRALSPTYRETLVMRLVERMTGPEISERTGMTHGSVRVHLHRGMKLLTEELARRGLVE